MQEQKEKQSSYYIEADLTEMSRQILQSSIVSQELGGLFPKQQNLAGISSVLDLGCGPGAWTLEAAYVYPHMHFTGVDVDPTVLNYARARMWATGITNTDFQMMDVTEPLQFQAETFDLIYGRFLLGFMRCEDWPKMIQECLRILRPGGTLLLTEGDTWVVSQSPAIATISTYLYQALWLSGQAFCADGRGIGVSPMLPYFLEEAGYEHVVVGGHAIDVSYGARAYPSMVQDTLLLLKHLQPFLERQNVVTAEDLNTLYHQGIEEIRHKSYRAFWYITQVSGRKPFR